ncbi:MAG: alpha/beta fold hydrolase [Woeseia sp.]
MRSTFFSLLALAVFVYLCFCVYLYLFQRSFIYFPTPATAGAPAEELWFDTGNARLRIWRLHAERPDAIVYFGGNAEDVALNIPQFSDYFSARAVYLVNYRGYGGSSGVPTEAGLYRDAEAVFDFVKVSHRRISLIGRSLGCSVATHLAAMRSIDRLVLITPFDSLASLAREFYPIFPTSLLLKDKHDSSSRADRIKVPVLMLVAEHDEIIPYANSERLSAAIDPALVAVKVIDDTAHNSIGASPEYGRALRAFMAQGAGRSARP